MSFNPNDHKGKFLVVWHKHKALVVKIIEKVNDTFHEGNDDGDLVSYGNRMKVLLVKENGEATVTYDPSHVDIKLFDTHEEAKELAEWTNAV